MINIDSIFNKEKPIEYIAKVNVFYKRHRKRMDINDLLTIILRLTRRHNKSR